MPFASEVVVEQTDWTSSLHHHHWVQFDTFLIHVLHEQSIPFEFIETGKVYFPFGVCQYGKQYGFIQEAI